MYRQIYNLPEYQKTAGLQIRLNEKDSEEIARSVLLSL